jgi:activating signal cointegrator 1
MKAITIWQPYATLIMLGLKQYETRSWSTEYRGPLVIHAAKRWDEECDFDCIRVTELLQNETFTAASLGDERLRLFYMPMGETLGKALGVVDLKSCEHRHDGGSDFENAVGHFGPGRFGWECDRPRLFEEPIRHQGKQGLWTPEPYLEKAAKTLLSSSQI